MSIESSLQIYKNQCPELNYEKLKKIASDYFYSYFNPDEPTDCFETFCKKNELDSVSSGIVQLYFMKKKEVGKIPMPKSIKY